MNRARKGGELRAPWLVFLIWQVLKNHLVPLAHHFLSRDLPEGLVIIRNEHTVSFWRLSVPEKNAMSS
jgi:hypothetical protein